MTHGSLFTGIGGFDLGFERAGIKTIWQVESNEYCRQILKRNFPDAIRINDVRDCYRFSHEYIPCEACEEPFCERHGRHFFECDCIGYVEWEDEIPEVDIISGGFPCQPFSTAGKRQGRADDRYLWPEMLRVISCLRPHFVVAENVPGIANGFDSVLEDILTSLENEGYETVPPLIVPASAFGAPHRRDRIWILAHRISERGCSGEDSSKDAVHVDPCSKELAIKSYEEWWATEPGMGRMVNGVPYWVDRVRSLGNAVVPQVATWIGQILKESVK